MHGSILDLHRGTVVRRLDTYVIFTVSFHFLDTGAVR